MLTEEQLAEIVLSKQSDFEFKKPQPFSLTSVAQPLAVVPLMVFVTRCHGSRRDPFILVCKSNTAVVYHLLQILCCLEPKSKEASLLAAVLFWPTFYTDGQRNAGLAWLKDFLPYLADSEIPPWLDWSSAANNDFFNGLAFPQPISILP
jgi:hypothetical protein